MATKSPLEWTDATWNPVTGCTKISPGCKHCYAERMANRLKLMGQANYVNGFDVTSQPHMLELPLRLKTPKRIFVNSMSDLFHDDVPLSYIRQVFDIMRRAHWHQFQILTKRAERLEDLMHSPRMDAQCLDGSHLAIVGGESGPGARPVEASWVTDIREQCLQAGGAFFFKRGAAFKRKRPGVCSMAEPGIKCPHQIETKSVLMAMRLLFKRAMDLLLNSHVELRPLAAGQPPKPPCKGLCKGCKKPADRMPEPLSTTKPATALIANRG